MSTGQDFRETTEESGEARTVRQGEDPAEGAWLADDAYAVWVASHPQQVKKVICEDPEFSGLTFCGADFE
jgi:hypothetical protein